MTEIIYQEGGPGLVQVYKNPQASPFRCAMCGFSGGIMENGIKDPRAFVDFSFTIDYYGAVIFCTDCVANMAEQLGFMQPIHVERLRTKVAEQQDELITLRDQNVKLRKSIASLVIDTGSIVDIESSSIVETPTESTDLPEIRDFKITENSDESTESAIEQGSDGLSGPRPSFGPSGLFDL